VKRQQSETCGLVNPIHNTSQTRVDNSVERTLYKQSTMTHYHSTSLLMYHYYNSIIHDYITLSTNLLAVTTGSAQHPRLALMTTL